MVITIAVIPWRKYPSPPSPYTSCPQICTPSAGEAACCDIDQRMQSLSDSVRFYLNQFVALMFHVAVLLC
jgi:hypothetical protein